jgi:beta-lactamase superfamily II metal-dependent hydrolase
VRALQAAGATVYRTDRDGSVRLEQDGGALRVSTHV